MRNFEHPNRSVTVAKDGLAATSNPASTQVAVRILEMGGNAMDAAIAACAVQCVVEPGSTGIGGDCFCLYAPQGGDGVIAYDGAGWAPAAATPEAIGGTAIAATSPHAVTIPGAVDAWARLLADHGTMTLAEVLAPAIRLARDGYSVAPRAAADWQHMAKLLANDPNAAALFLPGGKPPIAGDLHRQPGLADALEMIARDGRDAFYKGALAGDVLGHLQSLGGLHQAGDFASYQGRYVDPIKLSYRGHEVWECPPSGQGVIALLILNILAGYGDSYPPLSADRLHIEIEATRLAYSIRDAVLGDPSFGEVPVDWLLSDELTAQLRARIDLTRAIPDLPAVEPPKHKDTVYISVVDKDRNTVSLINSVFSLFGSGLVTPDYGILLHNRGESFNLTSGHPNCIGPHKRPLHTIIPGLVTKEGRAVMSFGVMGGQYQALGHAHFLTRVFDYGANIQAAMETPRFFPLPGTSKVEVEGTMPADVVAELERRGFTIVAPARAIGGAQAIRIGWDQGTLMGASDPRKDGCALGSA